MRSGNALDGPLMVMAAVFHDAKSRGRADSPRAHTLEVILELAEQGTQLGRSRSSGEAPLEQLDIMLTVRDIAREE